MDGRGQCAEKGTAGVQGHRRQERERARRGVDRGVSDRGYYVCLCVCVSACVCICEETRSRPSLHTLLPHY